jgi:hypothetical protein
MIETLAIAAVAFVTIVVVGVLGLFVGLSITAAEYEKARE